MRSLWPFTAFARSRQAKRLLILRLLAQHGRMRGLELVMLSGGKLGRGTVYVWLSELEDAGVIASAYETRPPHSASGLRLQHRVYWITDVGRAELAGWGDDAKRGFVAR